jgi:hypothetical protein
MDAIAILDRLREVGVTVRPDGDDLVLKPGDRIPPDLYEPIRAYKPQIMDILRGSKPPLVDSSPEWAAETVAREVIEYGIPIFWADVFQDTIAFIRGEKHRPQVPAWIVVYSLDELSNLFPDGKNAVGIAAMRLAHKAKKLGGGWVLDVQNSR